MKVLFVAGESVPFIKTGGLADVVGSLPKNLKEKGVDVRVVLPLYRDIPQKFKDQMIYLTNFDVQMGWKTLYCGILTLEHDGIQYYFIDNMELFDREGLYGYWDDGERYAFFSMAAIEMMQHVDFIPNIIHVHDWHAAMIPLLLVYKYNWIENYRNIRKVLTIHNLRFQGIFDPIVMESLFGITEDIEDILHNGNVNYLKAGIQYADVITTVSPSYASEIQTEQFGEGLDDILRFNDWKLRGILNGIDLDIYNPKTDPHINHNFGIMSLDNKLKNKMELQEKLGLPVDKDIPMIASISRLTDQKGFNLVNEVIDQILGRDVQLVILGTGDTDYEENFKYQASLHPSKMKALILFDGKLAQEIYAASDMFLMPSAFEPCGLSQLMSLRYGTVPIVHETGGLRDTVEPYYESKNRGTGFTFYEFKSTVMLNMIDAALWLYKDQIKWRQLMRRGMKADFNWDASVDKYIEVYQELLG